VRVVTDNIGFLLGGLLITLELTAIGFVGALLLGTVLAVFRVSPIPPLRAAGAVYVEVLRNMPLLSLLVRRQPGGRLRGGAAGGRAADDGLIGSSGRQLR
jgi:ABC-type amino acid transport system permease subunit